MIVGPPVTVVVTSQELEMLSSWSLVVPPLVTVNLTVNDPGEPTFTVIGPTVVAFPDVMEAGVV